MIFNLEKSKYDISISSNFKKNYKKIRKQGKDINKLIYVLEKLSNGDKLEEKYRDHLLIDDNVYKNCRECHIESDWLLVYRIDNNQLILLLVATGSHSEIFN